MKNYSIFYCESNSSFLSSAVEFFKTDDDIELISCSSLKEFNEKTAKHTINALIVDYEFLGTRDVIAAAAKCSAPVLLTGKFTEDALSRIKLYSFHAVLYKPYSLIELRSKIMKLLLGNQVKTYFGTDTNLDERIGNIFIRAGIPPHIKGYQFLREAVKFVIVCPELINRITKGLYPSVAELFNTTPSKVERAIRHAIEVAWNRGKIENINAIFGIKIYNKGEKPTNGELIALIADKLLTELQ